MGIIKSEILEIAEKYGDERRTNIEFNAEEINIEDLIPNEEVVITISHKGYIKRTLLTEYREQTVEVGDLKVFRIVTRTLLSTYLLLAHITIFYYLQSRVGVSG